ncbi:MAG TPA: aminotransferase class I/II-fold pyridoxal phosphate-dependent enzyme, partial [Candidatus Binataceae bacterium]|nr:aminotransferase class I/II-fold pyridoxal phosphate-dependent enzyme [Candidatus Binataceae bacterium]
DGILDFSVSINPLGPPSEALDAYHRAVSQIGKYPAPYASALEEKIADSLRIDPECVLAGNGTTQLIFLIARVVKLRAPHVVIPTFSEISNALIAASSMPRAIELDTARDFTFESRAIRTAIESGADAIFVGRPNSPTGTSLTFEEAVEIGQEASRRGVWCVLDEAFLEFAADDRSMATLAARDPRVVVLRSMTKIFAIPGLRLGYVISHPDTIRRLRSAFEPWSVNVVAEQVGLACLKVAQEFIARTRTLIAQKRDRLAIALEQNPQVHVIPSLANFLMLRISDETESGEFARHLLKHRIAIRDLAKLPGAGPGFYRIGLRSVADNNLLLDAAGTWR